MPTFHVSSQEKYVPFSEEKFQSIVMAAQVCKDASSLKIDNRCLGNLSLNRQGPRQKVMQNARVLDTIRRLIEDFLAKIAAQQSIDI